MSDPVITCEKCGMRMTTRQEAESFACIVVDCPQPNAGPQGARMAKAKPEDRRGIIIGRPGFPHHKMRADARRRK